MIEANYFHPHPHLRLPSVCPSDKLFRYRHTRRRLRQQKTECENVQNANMAAVVAAAADKLFLGYLRSPEKKAVKRKVDEFEIGVRSEREHCSTHNTQQSQSRREKRWIKKKTKCNPPKYIQQRRRRRDGERRREKEEPNNKVRKNFAKRTRRRPADSCKRSRTWLFSLSLDPNTRKQLAQNFQSRIMTYGS